MTNRNRRWFGAVCAGFLAIWAFVCVAPAEGGVGDLVAKMPAESAAASDQINAALVQFGPGAVKEICAMLVPPGTGDDAKAQFAVSGIAKYVMRAGAEKERAMVAGALIDALAAAKDKDVKAFLISQLELAGNGESIAPLSGYLSDDRLCDPAAQALIRIGGPEAANALAKALGDVDGAKRVTVIKALGELRNQASVKDLLPFATHADKTTRLTALFALANIGDLQAEPVLAKAAEMAVSRAERGETTSYCLLYAKRLAESGNKKGCEKICRDLIQNRKDSKETNVRCAALSMLVTARKKGALPDVLAAMDDADAAYRGAALQLARAFPGKSATRKWTAKMAQARPQVRGEILAMLGNRGDKTALPAVLADLSDQDAGVRIAAADAAVRLGQERALQPLLAAFQTATDADEIRAMKESLLRVPGAEFPKVVAQVLPKAHAAQRKALLEILAARRAKAEIETVFAQTKGQEEAVELAAIEALANVAAEKDLARLVELLKTAQSDAEQAAARKSVIAVAKQTADAERRADPVLAAMAGADSRQEAVLLATLPGLGGQQALETAVKKTKSADKHVQDAALRAVADWPDATAIPALLQIVKDGPDETYQVLALRGFVRLVGVAEKSADEKLALCKAAMAVVTRPDDKKLVLASVADVRTLDALQYAATFLDDKDLQADAALAAVKIACPQNDQDKGLSAVDVAAVLKKALPLIADGELRKKAEAHIATIPIPDAEGFEPLFNGKDLTGWTGDTQGYLVEDGKIVCRPGGNLYTQGEYANFVLRFEFKLTPGANNGLGIRAPLTGNAAYAGMEIQILDDRDPQYKDIHAYQAHGSIYGVVPAERDHLKPVGEWNAEEVTAKGRQVTVKLNGATIVDADLDKASTPQTVDGNAHPGLKNDTGHIGFLGHGTVVEFRNIRIKTLP